MAAVLLLKGRANQVCSESLFHCSPLSFLRLIFLVVFTVSYEKRDSTAQSRVNSLTHFDDINDVKVPPVSKACQFQILDLICMVFVSL